MMRQIIWCFLVILTGTMCSGSGDSEHVHFKIHVPDVVKHHIHTKTVFVHVHKPKPKKKPGKKKPPMQNHHKEEHHEDWSSWSSYGHHEDHEDKHSYEKNHFEDHKDHKDEKINQHNVGHTHYQTPPVNSQNDKFHEEFHKDVPTQGYKESHKEQHGKSELYNHHLDTHSHFPQWNSYDVEQYRHSGNREWTPGRMLEFSHPSQYAVRENTKDRSNEVEPYGYQYELGYRKGLLSQSKHLFEDQSSKFEDSKHEEEGERKESYESDSVERTHAGRYLVDDTEYENYRNHQKDKDSFARRHN